jgi:DNA-binding response OmpR family regulator
MSRCRILVIEDEPAIRRGIVDALRSARYDPIECSDGAEGLEAAVGAEVDLLLLDLMLPSVDGMTILAETRKARPGLPIIILTARGSETERVSGLRGGADDYIVKPFGARELLARIEAVLRRSAERPLPITTIALGDGREIDFERRELKVPGGDPRALSEREVQILEYLARNRGRAITRRELLERVWGLDARRLHTRTIDMHVARLREKIGDRADQIVVTVRGKGYMIGETIR